MEIDWERNELHVNSGRSEIAIDGRWKNDIAVEVDRCIELFSSFCGEKGLQVTVHTQYASGVDRNKTNTALGFVTASTPEWAGEVVSTTMRIPELDEFAIGISFVVDEN